MALSRSIPFFPIIALHCIGERVAVNPRFVQISINGHDHLSSTRLRIRWSAQQTHSRLVVFSSTRVKKWIKSHFPLILITIISLCLVRAGSHLVTRGWPHMYPGHTGHNLSSSCRFLRRSLMLPYQAATTKQISFALLRKSMWREQRKSCDRRGPGRNAVRFYSFFFQNSHKNQFLVWRRLVFN